MLILVLENLRNFQENPRMTQYVSYAGFQRGNAVIIWCFQVFSGPSRTSSDTQFHAFLCINTSLGTRGK